MERLSQAFVFIRPLAVAAFLATNVSSQELSFGLKAGGPITPLVQAGPSSATINAGLSSAASATTNPYIAGGFVEFRLLRNLSLEFDVLYRHLHYSDSFFLPFLGGDFEHVSAIAWESPLLLKYRLRGDAAHPFVSAGPALGVVALKNSFAEFSGIGPPFQTTTGTDSSSLALRNTVVAGFTGGAGVEIPAGRFRISPEVRYTYWFRPHFYTIGTYMGGARNQLEFLLGFRH